MNSFYRLFIKGRNPKYFLSLLISKDISIYSYQENSDGIILLVNSKGYQEILKIKTSYSITVLNRYGFAKIFYLFHKYFVFLLGLCFSFFLLLILSKITFNIEVIHSNAQIRELILNDLEEFGISKFHFKVNYQKKRQIIDQILEKETDHIEWLEIEEVGTKYIVRVEERKKNKKEQVCVAQNIVAKKDAMILEIHADAGEVKKKRFDYVKKGDVLISGLIYNKDKIVSKRCAIGQVYGEVWYQVVLEIPKHYHEENITGKKKKNIEIQFLDKNYHLFSGFNTYQKESITIFSSRILPIKFLFSTFLETNVLDQYYSIDDIDAIAYERAEEKLRQRLYEKDEILTKKILKKYEKDSKIIVEVFFKVKEDITEAVNIENIDITEENLKKEE